MMMLMALTPRCCWAEESRGRFPDPILPQVDAAGPHEAQVVSAVDPVQTIPRSPAQRSEDGVLGEGLEDPCIVAEGPAEGLGLGTVVEIRPRPEPPFLPQ